MRRLGILSTFCLLVLASISFGADALKPGDMVAIIGDSITEQKQYSVFMEDYLLACQPAPGLHTMQFGWGGETAAGFKHRMENDCLRYHPTVATTCYGMNDGGYSPQTEGKAKNYHDNQVGIVEGLKKAGVRLIVIGSPGCVDTYKFRRDKTDLSDALSPAAEMYNKTLASERDIAKQVAEEQGVMFANVYDPLRAACDSAKAKNGNKYDVCGGDGVHPGPNGHLIMAYAFLKALGCDGNIGTITVDLAGDKAEATDGHKILSAKDGVMQIESTHYPFCFPVADNARNPKNPINVPGILEFVPFNQELNRLMLVVKGAGDGKVKVTWGEASKEFAAVDLAKGINLAAEFLDNPFLEPFKKVDTAVRAQQNFETPMIKQTIHSIAFPAKGAEKPSDPDKVANEAAAKDNELSAAALKSVEPVKHTLKLEVVK